MVHGPHVLITRPSGQHEQFSHGCKALGLQVSHLPCLAINALPNPLLQSELISDADSVLFTSLNAVEHAHALLPLPWPGATVHAIGLATANALLEKGQSLAVQPAAPYNSEAYLTQHASNVAEQLIIIKGQGGRTQISERLTELGWHVQSLDVYKRVMPDTSPTRINEIFRLSPPDIVCVTSNETLSNLVSMVGVYRSALLRMQLVVNSDRCATLAIDLGFRNAALVTKAAGDQGQLSVLKRWLKHNT